MAIVDRQLGDAEVEQLDALTAADLGVGDQEDVVGLEIAMDDADPVRGAQRRGDLPRDACGDQRGELSEALESRAERFALEELHDDVRVARGREPEVVDLDDARVADRRRGARLVEEALHDPGIARELREQHLHRRQPTERRVYRLVDDAHAAPPDLAPHCVAADDGHCCSTRLTPAEKQHRGHREQRAAACG